MSHNFESTLNNFDNIRLGNISLFRMVKNKLVSHGRPTKETKWQIVRLHYLSSYHPPLLFRSSLSLHHSSTSNANIPFIRRRPINNGKCSVWNSASKNLRTCQDVLQIYRHVRNQTWCAHRHSPRIFIRRSHLSYNGRWTGTTTLPHLTEYCVTLCLSTTEVGGVEEALWCWYRRYSLSTCYFSNGP
jgi:hypothetical protein